MEQVLFGGRDNSLHTTSTEYNSLVGGYSWNAAILYYIKVISTDGIIKNLRVKLHDGSNNPVSPGAGKHYTFTLMVNGAPSALTFDIADAATSGSNMVDEIDVVPGDYVSLQCDPDGTPDAARAIWTSMFEGDTANESIILGSVTDLHASDTEYAQVMNGISFMTTTEVNFRQVVPTAGTLKDFYVKLEQDPGSAGVDGFKFTVRLNGATVAQSLVVTIMADNTTGFDLTHNLVVAAGDILTMMVEPIDTPIDFTRAGWGMTFVADVDGESIILGGSRYSPSTSADRFNSLISRQGENWGFNDYLRMQLGLVCVIKKLYILLNGAPGIGKSYTFSIGIIGDSNDVVAVVDENNVTGNSAALTDTVALDDIVFIKSAPAGSPAIISAYWGLVGYIEVVVGGVNYPISLSPGLAASATIDRDVAWDRGMSPGLTTAVSILAVWGRTITTSVGLAIDVILSRKVAWDRDLTPGLTSAIAILKVWGRVIATTTNLTASVTLSRIIAYKRVSASGLTAVVIVLKVWGRTIATTTGLAASVTVVKSFGRLITSAPGLTISVTVDRGVAYARATSAGLTAAVTIVATHVAGAVHYLITTASNLAVSVTVDRAVAYNRAVTAGLTSAVTILKGWGRSITTSVGLTAAVTILKVWGRTITTTADLVLSTTIVRTVDFRRSISAGTGLSVSISVMKSLGRTITTTSGLALRVSITIAGIWEWIRLTLLGRSRNLTLVARTQSLTLNNRTWNLTLPIIPGR